MRSDDITGYLLLDAEGRTVGPITGFWIDRDHARPSFANVRTGALRGRDRVVPLHRARLDDRRRQLQVDATLEQIRDAPAFSPDARLSDADERAILAHYHAAPEDAAPRAHDALARDIPLHEERVDVGKRVVRAGAVRLRKVVRTRIVQQPVEVRYEEIVIERIPYGEVPADLQEGGTLPSTPFREGEIVFRELAEEPVVTKRTELVGGVRASTSVETVHEDVEATVRREDVEIEDSRSREWRA